MSKHHVTLVEVGPRDGLQNESCSLPVGLRVELVERLVAAGLSVIEAGSFVSPKWVPQMAGTAEVLAGIAPAPGLRLPVLVPNRQGLQAAMDAGVREIAVFTAASETFAFKNLNCSIGDSLVRFAPVIDEARLAGLRVRGYVSCVLGCPYEGSVAPERVVDVSASLLKLGCDEISLGDTIGAGTPDTTRRLIRELAREVPVERLAGHFHDTWGMAAANVYAAWLEGMRTFDCSVGGLGGCPYAPGATGNVATEDLVHLFDGMGITTGVSLAAVVETAHWISRQLGRQPASRAARAWLARHPLPVEAR
ncbi:hydroxymethylglutaryl-CoA lyase [Laribacter hongkongensis]|uniref:hydroxymethylglutaryl-CoA lyase n=1 Tax=Laribacter hongkongensis TaxID=168471 RepID=UPI001EFD6A4E|nr:hydroxymethylglutaryl-CoA lyase [Laribacter hongkongensis]MCG9051510.1 hydroxymethylglutaryl-CoA lyase [Laribacter hongkongensis]